MPFDTFHIPKVSPSHTLTCLFLVAAVSSISTDVLNSSDSGVQFDVNKGKSSGSNFL